MKSLTLEERKARIDNIKQADADNKVYYRRHRVYQYLPGQVLYHLGDYPSYFTTEPTEYDISLIQELRENGADLIQLHEEWNDNLRGFGADKFTSVDPEGLQHFVDLCHDNQLKIIPYISSGYFQESDPDFRMEFVRSDCHLSGGAVHFRQCHAGSEGWVNYLLGRVTSLLDQYGFDGIYNDAGYDGWVLAWRKARAEGKDVPDFPYEPEFEDLLVTLYQEAKRRNGIYKLHYNRNDCPVTKDRVYDYLWIGEATPDVTPGTGKEYRDYIVPCPDFRQIDDHPISYHFVRTIPFMQFPLLTRGRPYHGNVCLDGFKLYNANGTERLEPITGGGRMAQIREYMKEHPDGPYVYSEWSPIPDDPMYYTLWKKYLALYKPNVTETSVVYIQHQETGEILSPIPKDVVVSMFVNEKKYLVLSNLSQEEYTLSLRDEWMNRETKERNKIFTLAQGEMVFLEKI